MARALSRLPIRPVAAALLLAAGLFGFAGRAEAGCGDYVTVDGRPVVDHEHAPLPSEPCHGPNCSVRQSPPAAPLAPPVKLNPAPKDRSASLFIAADPSPGFDEPLAPDAGHPVRRSYPPFHPPRSV